MFEFLTGEDASHDQMAIILRELQTASTLVRGEGGREGEREGERGREGKRGGEE